MSVSERSNSFLVALQPGGILERAALYRRPFNAIFVPRQRQLDALRITELLETKPEPLLVMEDSAILQAIAKLKRSGKINGGSDAEELALRMRIAHPNEGVREVLAYFLENHLAIFDSNGLAPTFSLASGIRGSLSENLDSIRVSGQIEEIKVFEHGPPSVSPDALSSAALNLFFIGGTTIDTFDFKMRLESVKDTKQTRTQTNDKNMTGSGDKGASVCSSRDRADQAASRATKRGDRALERTRKDKDHTEPSSSRALPQETSCVKTHTEAESNTTAFPHALEESTYGDEIELLQMMFQPEELTFSEFTENGSTESVVSFRTDRGYTISNTDGGAAGSSSVSIAVEIRIPSRGYPNQRKPTIRVTEAPNVSYGHQLEKSITTTLDELELGVPMLALIMSSIQEEIEKVVESVRGEADKREAAKAADEARQRELEEELASLETCARKTHMVSSKFGIRIDRGEIISERKSRFLAHIAKVSSVEEVEDVVKELAANKWLAASAHPTIYAYRFVDKEGRISQDAEDDGEDGASKKMLFLLEQCNVMGYVLVVTRWFGGILLGPDRFKRIMECSRQALQQHNVIE